MSNLNLISPNFRDSLLKRNLILSDTIVKNGYSSFAHGLGKPAIIGDGENTVKDSLDASEDAVFYKDLNTIINKYRNSDSNANDLPIINSINSSEYYSKTTNTKYNPEESALISKNDSIRNNLLNKNPYKNSGENEIFDTKYDLPQREFFNQNYLEKYGDRQSQSVVNTIGSFLDGNGIGITPNGIDTSFDIKSSLAGRVLGINDSPIGVESAKGLKFALLNNLAFNTQQETIGRVNTNIGSLLSGDGIIKPNYDITIPENGLGKAIDIIGRFTGVESPKSFLPNDSSIFSFDEKGNPLYNCISQGQSIFDDTHNQALINNTGDGQVSLLFANLKQNKYKPNYTKNGKGVVGEYYKNKSSDYQSVKELKSQQSNNIDFTWVENEDISITNQNSLLYKTNQLFKFNSDGKSTIKSLINKKSIAVTPDDISSTVKVNGVDSMSKGNAVLNADGNTFCRVWTSLDRYGIGGGDRQGYETFQKSRGLYERNSSSKLSVLDENGFVRISPLKRNGGEKDNEVKRFMFSLENLAWADSENFADLRECEIGYGDPSNPDVRGRIMWFPPYELSFNDNSSVRWDSNDFIGRGEPVYTYNNTERTGVLSFKMISDYSSAFELYKQDNKTVDEINRLIFGCDEIDGRLLKNLSKTQIKRIEEERAKNFTPNEKVSNETFSDVIEFFFLNDVSSVEKNVSLNYEDGDDQGVGLVLGDYGATWVNNTDNGLNVNFYSNIDELLDKAVNNDSIIIKINGFASSQGNVDNNIELATNRANSLKSYLQSIKPELGDDRFKLPTKTTEVNIIDVTGNEYDSLSVKEARKCDIELVSDPNKVKENKPEEVVKNDETDNTELTDEILSNFFNECSYFEYIEKESPIAYRDINNAIKEEIKFFKPAFHSITPEGLNSRLNFLLQCTRQGPTGGGDINPSNLAFGRQPVCILRVGDFYHTKIIIDNVDLNFDVIGGGIQWDMNPEGIGIQPMIVDVNISFKFIGGSSLAGPISKLQNAVSFNYFANTEFYDDRADKIDGGEVINGSTNISNEMVQDNEISTSKTPVEYNQVVNNETNNEETQIIDDSDDSEFLRNLKFSTVDFNNNVLNIKMINDNATTSTNNDYAATVTINKSNSNDISGMNVLLDKILMNAGNLTTEDFHYDIDLETGVYYIKVEWNDDDNTIKNDILEVK